MARTGSRPVLGWNAGANSILSLDGDVVTRFYVPAQALGIVIGFKTSRDFQTLHQTIEFGFFFTSVAGADLFYVTEMGQQRMAPLPRSPESRFSILRQDGIVYYMKKDNDATEDRVIHVSDQRSYGPLIVNACLFATGDAVA